MTACASMRPFRLLLSGLLVVVGLSGALPAALAEVPVLPASVRDLHFGDAIFYFYQDDYFTAITRLQAAEARGQLGFHAEEAQLLLGGMYLAYGQHRSAGEVFARLLDSKAPEVRNRAWFYLARLRFQRGYLDEAMAALASIDGVLDASLEPLRRQLQVQLLLSQGQYAEAIQVIDEHEQEGDWALFSAFNLGVALMRDGRFAEGEQLLSKLGTRKAGNEEMRALKDKANLALAFSLLQRERPAEARVALNRVYLDGAQSGKALLGAAWADISQESFQKALVPLRALSLRDAKDPAVQEALLARPYALASLAATRQAAEAYELAIRAFTDESSRLRQSIAAIRDGALIKTLIDRQGPRSMGWFWKLADVSNAPESLYLYELMADHAFQENLKNYRDLLFLEKNLARWAQDISAFDDMLGLARQAHGARLPGTLASFQGLDLASLAARTEALTKRLAGIREQGDPAALANTEERAILARLTDIEARLAQIPDAAARANNADRVRLLRGVLTWQLQKDWSERLWALDKSLNTAREGFAEAQGRALTLEQTLVQAPQRFAGFGDRISSGNARLSELRSRLGTVLAAQAGELNESAVTVLAARQEVLDAYTVQARFALAAIYDRASLAAGAP